ncbi:MAG: hypothetical protein V4639_00205 [Pseudomonadota bacterium]
MNTRAEVLVDCRNATGDSPVWLVAGQAAAPGRHPGMRGLPEAARL